jgi:regulator of protease activity HflC (stomatin/prohibitin superfamily)
MANDGRPTLRMGAVAFAIAIGVLLLFLLRFSPIRLIPAGHVGVLTVFGRVTGQVVGEGVNVVNPLATTHVMSIRTQEVKESASVPSKEGLILRMDTSILFHLDTNHAAQVFQKVGPNYVDVVIEPNLRSAIRSATAENSANALYTGGRELVAQRSSPSSERPSRTAAWSSRTCCCATFSCPRP